VWFDVDPYWLRNLVLSPLHDSVPPCHLNSTLKVQFSLHMIQIFSTLIELANASRRLKSSLSSIKNKLAAKDLVQMGLKNLPVSSNIRFIIQYKRRSQIMGNTVSLIG
jgi:hypothetical protein